MLALSLLLTTLACGPGTGDKVDQMLTALHIGPGSKVADVGAGRGEHAARLARVVGAGGHVYAVDIDPGAIRRVKEKAEQENLPNLEAVLGAKDDPKLPAAALDAILTVISYHEMEQHEQMLVRMREALKPGGRLVMVDFMPGPTRGRPREAQVNSHKLAPEIVEPELRAAGFEILERQDGFMADPDSEERRWLIVARKP